MNKTRKEAQLAKARQTLVEKGKSPRQLGEESRLKVIRFIYHFGFSSASIIQLLLQRTAGGYAHKLEKQGFLVSSKTQSGIPRSFYTLSQSGLDDAEHQIEDLLRYPEIDPYKVNQQLIRHDLLAQLVTVNAINSGTIIDYETERMFSKNGDKSGIKRPDVVWITKSGLRIGVEIELTGKWDRDLDEFIFKIFRALESTVDTPADYSRFTIISDSKAIINRYKKAFNPGSTVSIWKKNDRKHWVIEKKIEIPDWLIEKIDFQLNDR